MKDFFETQLAAVQKDLMEQWELLRNAGVGTQGDIKNRIQQLDVLEKELKAKLEDLDKKIKGETEKKLVIFIITSTKANVEANIGNDLAKHLPGICYDEEDSRNWKPFIKEPAKTIEQMIDEFKNESNRDFDHLYLDGELTNETYVKIDVSKKGSIAIIDLLALDEKNTTNATRFDTVDFLLVLTPICSRMDNALKDYMEDRRKMVFKNLETRIRKISDDTPANFDPDTPSDIKFKDILKSTFNKFLPVRNYIKGPESDQDNKRRVALAGPSF